MNDFSDCDMLESRLHQWGFFDFDLIVSDWEPSLIDVFLFNKKRTLTVSTALKFTETNLEDFLQKVLPLPERK